MNAIEILEVVKEHYSEREFAYGEWLETKKEKDFIYSETAEKATEARNIFHEEKVKTHPDYGKNKENQGEEFKSLWKEYCELLGSYELKEIEWLKHIGLGEIEEVDQYGGEGCGDNWYSIKFFKDHNVYIKTTGHYSSYHGTDFENGYGEEVKPVTKEVVVYE